MGGYPQCKVHHFIMFRDAFHGIQSLHRLLKYSSIAFNIWSLKKSCYIHLWRMESSLQLWNKVVLCPIKLVCLWDLKHHILVDLILRNRTKCRSWNVFQEEVVINYICWEACLSLCRLVNIFRIQWQSIYLHSIM